MENVDYQFNYVTQVSSTYNPVVYTSNGNLNEYLKQKFIINQTNHQLTDTEIELLALGLDFNVKLSGLEDLMNAAQLLRNQNTFYVMQSADKNVIVLWNIVDYEREANRTLCAEETYAKVWHEEANKSEYKRNGNKSDGDASYQWRWVCDTILKTLMQEKNTFVKRLEHKGCINMQTSLTMQKKKKEDQMMLPYVSFLPDVTKQIHPTTGTFQSTAIVNTENGPLHPLDNYMANLAYPMLDWIPGVFNGLTHLMDGIQSKMDNWKADRTAASQENKPMKTCCEDGHPLRYLGLRVANAGQFFPSIDVNQGIEATCNVYQRNYVRLCDYNFEKNLLLPVDPATFRDILQFIFNNTFLTFENKSIFRQKKGVPIGNRMSVFVAHCFMYSITNHIIDYPPKWLLMFKRVAGEFFFLICHHPDHGKRVLPDLLWSISNYGRIKYELDKYDKGQRKHLMCHHIKGEHDNSDYNCFLLNGQMPPILRHCIIFDVCISFNPDRFSFRSEPYVKHLEAHQYRVTNDPRQRCKETMLAQCTGLKSKCSSNAIFFKAEKSVLKQFVNRGYSKYECYVTFAEIDRNEQFSAFSRDRSNSPPM